MIVRKKLFWQIYPSFLVAMIIPIAMVAIYIYSSIQSFHINQVQTDLEARARLVDQLIANGLSKSPDSLQNLCIRLKREAETRITIIAPDGKVIAESEKDPKTVENHGDRPEVREALTGKVGHAIRYSSTVHANLLYLAVPLYRGNELLAITRVARPLTEVEHELSNLLLKLCWLGLGLALFVALLSYIVSRQISKPLEILEQGAKRFSNGDLESKLFVPDNLEMAELALTLNLMAQNLKEKIDTVTQQKSQLETLIASMSDGVVAVDTNDHILVVNRKAAILFGNLFEGQPETLRGRILHEVIRHPDLQSILADTKKESGGLEREFQILAPIEKTVRARASVLLDDSGKIVGAITVLADITKARRMEIAQKEFVANVSHELRTPITSIQGYVETLQSDGFKDETAANKYLGIVSKQCLRLTSLITDLLQLSRLEQDLAGGLSRKDENVEDLLRHVVQSCQFQAGEKEIKIETKYVNIQAGDLFKVSATVLEQALINLIDNAIKYSGKGTSIQLEVVLNQSSKLTKSGKGLVFKVSDQGPGISKEHLDRLFERFYRVDKSRSRSLGGTGLGLSIVRQVAKAHGGEVHVQSEVGKGSEFIIEIPV